MLAANVDLFFGNGLGDEAFDEVEKFAVEEVQAVAVAALQLGADTCCGGVHGRDSCSIETQRRWSRLNKVFSARRNDRTGSMHDGVGFKTK
jgi:hypothetical protein